MKKFARPIHVGLITLLISSVLFTKIKAQPAPGLFAESKVSVQDNMTKNQETKALGLLDASLKSLSDEALRARRIGGYVLLGLGIGTGIGGAAVLASAGDDDTRTVGYALLGGGLLFGGLSAIPFKVTSEQERIYREFSDLSSDNSEQLRQKFYYGERRFEELAKKKRRERIISGFVSIATGLTILFYVDDDNDETRLGAFTGPLIGGIIIFMSKTDEERRFETYQRAKEDIIGNNNRKKIYFGIAPLMEGGILTAVQVRF
ncbi:hypothetical protein ACFL4Z_00750 [candidate division KSB1 bacterium]